MTSHSSLASTLPLPRHVLRHLLTDHQIGLGSRVLDVGCGHGDLVHLLDDLGLEATGVDESAENVTWAKELEPRSDFHLVQPPAEITLEHIGNDEPLDLIVVRQLAAYEGDLFSPASFSATSRLLQHLSGGGSFVFLLHRDVDTTSDSLAHETACFARHLSYFPGTCRVRHFLDCEFAVLASHWLHGQRHRGEIVMISLKVPEAQLEASDWRRFATEASLQQSNPCCPRVFHGKLRVA